MTNVNQKFTSEIGFSRLYGFTVLVMFTSSEDLVHVIIRTWLASSFADNSTGLMKGPFMAPRGGGE